MAVTRCSQGALLTSSTVADTPSTERGFAHISPSEGISWFPASSAFVAYSAPLSSLWLVAVAGAAFPARARIAVQWSPLVAVVAVVAAFPGGRILPP
ncbi:MAG: hypothetical protein ACK5PF_09430 [bacterium]